MEVINYKQQFCSHVYTFLHLKSEFISNWSQCAVRDKEDTRILNVQYEDRDFDCQLRRTRENYL